MVLDFSHCLIFFLRSLCLNFRDDLIIDFRLGHWDFCSRRMLCNSGDTRLDANRCLVPQYKLLLLIGFLFVLNDQFLELLTLPTWIRRVHCAAELWNERILKSILPLVFFFIQDKDVPLIFHWGNLLVVVANSTAAQIRCKMPYVSLFF